VVEISSHVSKRGYVIGGQTAGAHGPVLSIKCDSTVLLLY